jgi:hypothetical protein
VKLSMKMKWILIGTITGEKCAGGGEPPLLRLITRPQATKRVICLFCEAWPKNSSASEDFFDKLRRAAFAARLSFFNMF